MKDILRLARDILDELRGIRQALDSIAAKQTQPYIYTWPGTTGTSTTATPFVTWTANTGSGYNPPSNV